MTNNEYCKMLVACTKCGTPVEENNPPYEIDEKFFISFPSLCVKCVMTEEEKSDLNNYRLFDIPEIEIENDTIYPPYIPEKKGIFISLDDFENLKATLKRLASCVSSSGMLAALNFNVEILFEIIEKIERENEN